MTADDPVPSGSAETAGGSEPATSVPAPADDLVEQRPGAKRAAIAEEQAHVDRVHDRVEALRRRADERALEAAADRSGSTFQARFERDVTAHHHAARAARFTFGDVEQLAFGRIDTTDGDSLHVGRLSVVDDEGEVLLVDWRAPASAPFYRATAAEPAGVARRRMLVARGREVRDLDDEVLDADAAARLGLEAVTGQGALLAALSRTRSRHMRDIVATIQADQDRIIRAPASGTLVVKGGPGTGKTVVALHRVAYLLYGDRDRFEGRGVLVVGPSRAFTEYTARVLPSLGEDRAVQRPIEAFAPPGVTVRGWDDPDVAAVKGDLRMREVCRRAVAAAVPPLPPSTRVTFESTTVEVEAATLARLRARLLARLRPDREGGTYHGRAAGADESLVAALWKAWRAAHRRGGGQPPEAREGTGFEGALEDSAAVTMLRRCFWPSLEPGAVLGAVAGGERPLAELADGVLGDDEVALLTHAWERADGWWRVDDVALLDEVQALLGRLPEPASRRPSEADQGIRLTSDELRVELELADIEDEGYRDFAHVVVDEAQDLSPMQWRMLARRGPYASWTVVGDLAQRSRVAEPRTWDEVAELIGRRQVTLRELTVNYRTPVEIVAVAKAVLAAAGHDPDTVPTAVREGGEVPRLVHRDDVIGAAAALAVDRAAAREGTVAVIVQPADVDAVERRLDELAPEDLRDRVRVLDPRTAKGLEFDDVVVAAPEDIASASAVGYHQLYVAVTRATRSLTLVVRPDGDIPGAEACVAG